MKAARYDPLKDREVVVEYTIQPSGLDWYMKKSIPETPAKRQNYSSTCSTESTISFTNSFASPGMICSASVNARWRLLRALRASGVDTLGNNCMRAHQGVSGQRENIRRKDAHRGYDG